MNRRLTILCDNSVGPLAGTIGEHGFAALIEAADGTAMLFDTGQGFALLHNARTMGKDLARAEKVVISHGHYDHAGGLLPLLQEYGPREIFADEGIFCQRHRVKDSGEHYPIGIPHARPVYEQAGAAFNFSAEFRQIAPGIYLTGRVPRVTPFETGDAGIFCDAAGQVVDVTPDDQSLVLDTVRGLVVLLGCCHAGLVNTLEQITRQTGRRDFYAVIGGTHLGFCSREQFEGTIAAIRRLGIRKLAVSHCTGFAAAMRLAREMPREFQNAMVGYTLEMETVTR
jgi:7,8-dihydropterin-6-yl-methyl-4-(beta-D-ribofuranosyl)aminobenzene 5'-phosphate synthase